MVFVARGFVITLINQPNKLLGKYPPLVTRLLLGVEDTVDVKQ